MILYASWKALFTTINAINESGNRNIAGFTSAIAGFTGAMDADANLDVQMMCLTHPLGLLLIANNCRNDQRKRRGLSAHDVAWRC